MQLAFLTSLFFTATSLAQPGEPWTGPVVIVYGTDIYDVSHQFRVPDNGPALPVSRLAMMKSAYIESPSGASCTIAGRESIWELTEGTDYVIEPVEHFTSIICQSEE